VKRAQLEHIVRAAAGVAAKKGLLIVGSQSVLGTFSDRAPPPEAIRSMEADVLALKDDKPIAFDREITDRVDSAIGEESQFHREFGVYAQGVDLELVLLPSGWEDRLVSLRTPATKPGRALCLEPHDCVLSKMAAGRDKDYAFATALLKAGLVKPDILEARIDDMPIAAPEKHRIREWLRGNRPA